MNKIALLLFVLIFNYSVFSGENDYRIGFFWVWKNPSTQPPPRLWEQMDSLRCNFAHFGRHENAQQAKKILNAAKNNNISAQFQWNPLYNAHYFSTRMVYFAGKWNESRYFFRQNDPKSRTTGTEKYDATVLRNLPDVVDIQKRTVIHCQPNQDPEGYITQHLIDDRYPENWIYQIRLDDTYHLKARLRIRRQDNTQPSTPILLIACVERSSRKVVSERIVTLKDFPNLATEDYEEIELFSFQRPYRYKDRTTKKYVDNPPNPKDFERVRITLDFITFWYGQVETWLDYIKLDSDRAHKLFNGELDDNLISGMNQFKDHPALEHLYLKDEPEYAYFRPAHYINRLLQNNTNARGLVVTNKAVFNNEYTLLNGLRDYVFDAYPIRGYLVPVPPPYSNVRLGTIDEQLVPRYTTEAAYNDSLQKAFKEYFLKSVIAARTAADKHDVNIWYCPQSFSQKRRDEKIIKYRCPTPEELEATVYLALAYGVKGLFYFQYMNMSNDRRILGGVVNDKLIHSARTGKTTWGETLYIGNDILWKTLLRLNYQAEKILKITKDLISVSQFDENSLEPPFKKITNWNRDLSGHIHFGTFKDKDNAPYFLVVNKQCHPDAGQQFSLILSLAPNQKYIVRDLTQESNFKLNTDSSGEAQFNVNIGAGKGLLFKLYQVD